jgi:AraC-like DNA-binding protein
MWERRAEGGPPVRILPDGCVDVVWTEGAGTEIVGTNTTAFLVPLAAGRRAAGARLRPGAALALLGVAGEAVRDGRLSIVEVWASEGAQLAAALDEHVDPVEGLRAALLARAARADRPDPLVQTAVGWLTLPDITVAQLADELAVSERHLRRRVTAAIGYGPKQLARVLRLRRALQAARGGENLARAAIEAGYVDQAHFANDCRALAGVPASVLLAG